MISCVIKMSGRVFGLCVVLCGCSPPEGGTDLAERLQHQDPKVRLAAVGEVARTRNETALPLLVERLGDSRMDVRFFTARTLHDLTGLTMGYEAYAPADQRQAAIDRWRDWLRRHHTTPPQTQPTGERS